MKYVVQCKETWEYLSKTYYKDGKKTRFLEEAYQFSAFELLLASKTKLIGKNNYVVFLYEEEKEKNKEREDDLLGSLYEE